MIAADHDWGLGFAFSNQIVHSQTKLGAFPIAEPAKPGGQTLKLNTFLRQFHPRRKGCVLRKNLEREPIRPRDVARIAAQCHPAKRSFPFAEERPDVFWNESGNIEGILDSSLFRLGPDVISVVESD